MPTLFAASPLAERIVPSAQPVPVWPDPEGEVYGSSFLPLYKSAPKAARVDAALYELLVLVDAIRGVRRGSGIWESRKYRFGWRAIKRLNNPNLQMLETAVHRLGALVDESVFITKLEAFEGRGKGDFQMSHDIEDLVAVLDGRPLIVDEVLASETLLRAALTDRFIKLLGNPRFLDAVHGHLPTDRASQARVSIVINRMEQIASLPA